MQIAEHIRVIKELERQEEAITKQKIAIKEQQNRVHKQRKEQQERPTAQDALENLRANYKSML